MKRKLNFLLAIFICLTSLSLPIGCSHSEYESITVENELCSYSLTYPSIYEKQLRNLFDWDIPFSDLSLEGPISIQEAEIFDPDTGEIKIVSGKRGTSVIRIHIANFKGYFGETYSATDKIASVLEDEAKWANFELLNRAPLMVSGVEGEVIEYLVDMLMPIPKEDGKNLWYFCAVYFDYNGLTWVIEAQCIQELKEQVKADFDYIVASFVIIR